MTLPSVICKLSDCRDCGRCCEGCSNDFPNGCSLPPDEMPQDCQKYPFVHVPPTASAFEPFSTALGVESQEFRLYSRKLAISFFVDCKALLNDAHLSNIKFTLKAVNQLNQKNLTIYEEIKDDFIYIKITTIS